MMVGFKSYFSGAGLMDIGLIEAGLTPIQSYEMDKAACETYRHNLGDHMKQCDLTQELVKDQPEAPVHVFTYPCTRYSTIASISGTRTGDDLFLHALRHLAVESPEAFIVENVPGMKIFPIVMETMTRLKGYYAQVFCPISATTWLPQKRDRLIIIATKRRFGFRPPETSFRPVSLQSIIEDAPVEELPKSIHARMSGKYRDLPIICDPANGDIAPCAIAHYAKDRSTRVLVDKRYPDGVRPFSIREWARLQGVPDWFEFPVSNTNAYKQIGNGVAVPKARWVGSELLRYFNAKGGGRSKSKDNQMDLFAAA